jgi:DNA-binding MurR/RpiR family transcriptional regulator
MIIDFENIEEKCKKSFSSSEYDTLVRKIVDTKKIFVIGNGGLHFVASHMATDMTRLIKEKAVYSFELFKYNWCSSLG